MNALRKAILRATCAAALFCTAVFHPAAAQIGDVCAAASPTNPDDRPAGTGGMGGTGINAGTGGMGGTGINAGVGGMGGTGTMADVVPGTGGMGGTGIVGVITGFASICVNGVEVHYDARTPVAVNGQPGTPRNLAVGQVVAVNARMVGNRLEASGIGVIDAVAGPITRVNVAAREIQVMNQTVRVEGAAGADLSTLRVGTLARVAGHRSPNGDVIATRIDSGSGAASVLGTVTRVETDGVMVNGTRVNLGARGTRGINVGTEVFASGEWSGGALRAQRVDTQPVRSAIARNERAILEGYIRGKTTQTLNIIGVNVRIDARVRYNGGNDRDAVVGRKVQVEVRRTGNDWQAERVRLQRDGPQSGSVRDIQQGQGASGDNRDRGGQSDSERSGNSGRSGDDRSDSRDSGRSESRDSERSDSRDSRDSGRSGSRESGRSESRDSGSRSGSGRGGGDRR